MPSKPEAQIMAEAIIRQHDGQAYFNFGEASKIMGCSYSRLPERLTRAGIAVKRMGNSKRISAYDIACLMSSDRTAATHT